jgi:hypothetical protein
VDEREKKQPQHRNVKSRETGTQPVTKTRLSPVFDDDYTPSTPIRGNHSIYPTLALQGKAISPSLPTFLVCLTLFRYLTYLSHILALSSNL